eukprot:EG_transcript_3554
MPAGWPGVLRRVIQPHRIKTALACQQALRRATQSSRWVDPSQDKNVVRQPSSPRPGGAATDRRLPSGAAGTTAGGVRPQEGPLVQFCLKAEADADQLSPADTVARFRTWVALRRGRLPLSPLAHGLAQQALLRLAQHAAGPHRLAALAPADASLMLVELLSLRVERDTCLTALEGFLAKSNRLRGCPSHLLVKLLRLEGSAPSPNPDFMAMVAGHLATPDGVASLTPGDVGAVLRAFGQVADVAKGRHRPLCNALRDRLLDGTLLVQLSARDCAGCLWGMARLGFRDRRLAAALVEHAQTVGLERCQAPDIANLAWALATLGHHDGPLLPALVAHLCQTGLDQFQPQSLTDTLWALATLRHRDEAVLELFAQRVAQRGLRGFRASQVATIAWAFATLAHADRPAMEAVATWFAEVRPADLKPTEVVKVLAAFATLGCDPGPLIPVVLRFVRHADLTTFTAPELSSLLQSMATLGVRAQQPFQAVGDHLAARGLAALSAGDIAAVVRAFSAGGHLHRPLMMTIDKQLAQRGMNGVRPQDLATLLQGFAHLLLAETDTFRLLLEHLESCRLDGLAERDLANILWGCATAGVINDPLYAAVLPHLPAAAARPSCPQTAAALHPFFLHCRLNAARLPRTVALLDQRPDLLARCAEDFGQRSGSATPMHDDVAATLVQLQCPFQRGVVLSDAGGYTADFLVKGKRTVIGVAGYSHLLRSNDGWVPSGAAHLEHSQLEAFGYNLLHIPFYEWKQLYGVQAKRTFLRSLLLRSVVINPSGQPVPSSTPR